MNHNSWRLIFDKYDIWQHDFDENPYEITAEQIKSATAHLKKTTEKEVRILAKQDTRESRPDIFKEKGLFLLPIKNGIYNIIKGEGYLDIPSIDSEIITYQSVLDFTLDTSKIGNSEMQHLDFAYANSLIRSFLDDSSLVLTIRGRKYTPAFDFKVGKHELTTKSVQTEVDAGYEGKKQVVLIEAKNSSTKNTIIRQLYFPFRQWQEHTNKTVKILFFEKREEIYSFWEFGFEDKNNYNSIKLLKSARYQIKS